MSTSVNFSSTRLTALLAVLCLKATLGAGFRPLEAQEATEVRVLAVVDYVAGSDLYLALGSEQGVRPSDTLPVYDGEDEGARLLGAFLIVSATGRRSVANILGEPFTVERGTTLYLGIPRERVPQPDPLEPGAEAMGAGVPAAVGAASQASSSAARQPRFHGRVSLDYDAFRTTTRWGESSSAEETRTFSTPTFRLQARGQNLPGGLELGTGIRVSHRMSSDSIVQPVTSTRFYQLDLSKRFERVPLEMHLGRFHSPFDEFSGYWDGLLMRVGPEAVGAGVAVGYEPRWSNEGFGTERPKALGFVDFDVRGERVSYSGAFSFLGIRPQDSLPDRTSMGLSQRLRLGPLWIRQRLEMDQDSSGSKWDVTRFQLDGSVSLVGGLEAFGGWRRWRYVPLWTPGGSLGPQENRAVVGLSLWGRGGGGSVDLSMDRPEEGEGGRTVSGSFYLIRTPLSGIGIGASASHWSRGDDSALLVSPEVRASLGKVAFRGAYRFYRTVSRSAEVSTHFGDASFTMPLGAGLSVRLQGSTQWGGNLGSNRIFASIWKGF